MNTRMNVLFVMNGIGSVDGLSEISGGDVRWIEIAKCWQRDGFNIHVLTPEAGISLCKKLGLEADFHVSNVPNNYSVKAYFLRLLESKYIPRTLENFRGIVYSTTEHSYDVIPAWKMKEKTKGIVWAAVIHWVAPWRRKGTTLLNSTLFFLNQRLGLHYIKNWADIVLAVSSNTVEQVRRIGIRNNVFPVTAGADIEAIRNVASQVRNKKYDAIFMKRFTGTKGVFDMVEIWKEVTKIKPEAKLGMVGLGTRDVMNRLHKMVENYSMKYNISFLGPIYEFETKISVLASGEMLVLPSYEENWAIVIGEAMAAGVPVLCYDLPEIRPIWGGNVAWVPKGDKKKFADKTLELLDNDHARNKLSESGMRFIRNYDWHEIAQKEMSIITSLAEKHETTNK